MSIAMSKVRFLLQAECVLQQFHRTIQIFQYREPLRLFQPICGQRQHLLEILCRFLLGFREMRRATHPPGSVRARQPRHAALTVMPQVALAQQYLLRGIQHPIVEGHHLDIVRTVPLLAEVIEMRYGACHWFPDDRDDIVRLVAGVVSVHSRPIEVLESFVVVPDLVCDLHSERIEGAAASSADVQKQQVFVVLARRLDPLLPARSQVLQARAHDVSLWLCRSIAAVANICTVTTVISTSR
mmetsp:Transcript_6380/g.18777  ORF Transcript_6380/g.18777 Transcript_6380/m.18777 type:complete len:241 (-) Transcript_6380:210-932(-)